MVDCNQVHSTQPSDSCHSLYLNGYIAHQAGKSASQLKQNTIAYTEINP